jgi:hypothetical protein
VVSEKLVRNQKLELAAVEGSTLMSIDTTTAHLPGGNVMKEPVRRKYLY